MSMFEPGDELPEKMGTVLGAAFVAVVYFGAGIHDGRASDFI